MFGIDDQRNLIIQFPVLVQPYTQQHLKLYQMETVHSSNHVDENEQVQSYTYLEGKEIIYSSKFRDIYYIKNTRIGYLQKDRL